MKTSTYVKRFNNALKAYEGTTVKVPEVPLQVALFLRNLCDTRFRQFKVNLRSDFHQLNVAYPATINAAFTRAADWENDHPVPYRSSKPSQHHSTPQLKAHNRMKTLKRVVVERELDVVVKVGEDVGEDVIIPLSLPKANAMYAISVELLATTPIIVLVWRMPRQQSTMGKAFTQALKHMTLTVHPKMISSWTHNAHITYFETPTFCTICTHLQPPSLSMDRSKTHPSRQTRWDTSWTWKKKFTILMKLV
jgi:hypothetical protein